jgi:hypothetical protein
MLHSSKNRRRLSPWFRCALVSVVCAAGGGCGSKDAKAPAPAADPLAGLTVHAYVVRGEVATLPDAVQDFQVRHEAIPEFKNPDGSLGMDTMVMPFWPPQGLPKDDARIAARVAGFSLDGIAVGQPVEVAFDVLWNADGTILGYYATRVTSLPAGTPMDFTPLPKAP